MTKKLFISIIALLACSLLFAGCITIEENGTTSETPATSTEQTENTNEPSENTNDAPVTENGSQPVSNTPGDGATSIVGTVEDATMNTLVMSDATGVIYTFSTGGAEIVGDGGIVIGATVTVYFEGTIQPTDETQQVTVTKIEVQ